MKKLTKLKLNLNVEQMDDREMKSILGGIYDPGDSTICNSGKKECKSNKDCASNQRCTSSGGKQCCF